MILAGDVGGTNVRLATFERRDGHLVMLEQQKSKSRELPGLEDAVRRFVKGKGGITSAGFGVAGPVRNGRCEATNLPWVVDAASLAAEIGLPRVALVNDLAANGLGLSELEAKDFAVLNHGEEDHEGNGALISAGTGLGEAILLRESVPADGARAGAHVSFRPLPSEGGHATFAPRDAHEIKLLKFLMTRYGHVSFERVLSGPGLANVYAFERESSGAPEPPWMTAEMASGDPAPVVAAAALSGRDAVAQAALTRFARLYGGEAANLALKALATGGVFLGGGIAPKILPVLEDAFFGAFCDKGRFAPLLSRIPVKVILNDACALLGAARSAES